MALIYRPIICSAYALFEAPQHHISVLEFIDLISTFAFVAYDVALIYRPIIRSAYCHKLPCIEASQHHSSVLDFIGLISTLAFVALGLLSQAALYASRLQSIMAVSLVF